MKTILIALCLSSLYSFAESELPIVSYRLENSRMDSTLASDEAVYTFTFEEIRDTAAIRRVLYSIDGKASEAVLINNSYFEIPSTPGKHIFQFYYNENYMEVYTDSLAIKAQYRDDYIVQFREVLKVFTVEGIQPKIISVDKPVIYLYPETEIDVQVKMDVKGELAFTYPSYNEGWNFKASPDGTLAFGEDTYNYLFWESKQAVSLTTAAYRSGFVVKKTETLSFLEEKLTEAGLTSQEQADFITYWGPRLIQNEYNFIHFEFNETCNKYAELEITPTPDNVYRIYMTWMPSSKNHAANYKVKEQEIVPLNREGFTVVEWGGSEITTVKVPAKEPQIIKTNVSQR